MSVWSLSLFKYQKNLPEFFLDARNNIDLWASASTRLDLCTGPWQRKAAKWQPSHYKILHGQGWSHSCGSTANPLKTPRRLWGLALMSLRIEPLNHLFTALFWNTGKRSFTTIGTMKRHMRANRSHDAKGLVFLHAINTNHSQFFRINKINYFTNFSGNSDECLRANCSIDREVSEAGRLFHGSRSQLQTFILVLKKTIFDHRLPHSVNGLLWPV